MCIVTGTVTPLETFSSIVEESRLGHIKSASHVLTMSLMVK